MMWSLKTAIIFILFFNTITYAQIEYTQPPEKLKTKSWAVGILYAENGFGLFGTYSKKLGSITSWMARLSVSGVSDPNEVEYYDYYGNSYIRDKINRVYASTLSIGIKHNIFFDDIEGNFKPYVKGGIAPTLILMTPYERGFFNAFGYTQTSYGIGAFGGVGMEYYESRNLGMSLGIEYYYIPVLGNDVVSLIGHKITNVGGLQFSFNVMFF
jgi:hypothetical protein